MTTFTEADFLASTTIMTRARTRKLKLAVTMPNLRLPVAPPSPICVDGDDDINTEPFPLFKNIYPPSEPERLHCVLHCTFASCKYLKERRSIPPCRCPNAGKPSPTQKLVLTFAAAKVSLDETIFDAIQGLEARTNPDYLVALERSEALALLSRLEGMIAARAIKNDDHIAPLRAKYPVPGNKASRVLRSMVEEFFESMHDYIKRVTQVSRRHSLPVRQLRIELDVYMATGFRKMLEAQSDLWTQKEIYDNMYKRSMHPLKLMGTITEGEYAVVARVWEAALDNVVGMLIWRSAEA